MVYIETSVGLKLFLATLLHDLTYFISLVLFIGGPCGGTGKSGS